MIPKTFWNLATWAYKLSGVQSETIIDDEWRTIDRSKYNLASTNPGFREALRETSIREDEENSYYMALLNLIADQTVGSCPMLLGDHPDNKVNDKVEDAWLDWAIDNSIGANIRQIRRGAASTGIGIAIPYEVEITETNPIGLKLKPICTSQLINPPFSMTIEDRIIDGIKYDENWDPEAIFVESGDPYNPTEYQVKDILFWHKQRRSNPAINMLPECGPAFCLFPSVRRYMNAVVRAEEFRSCIPMAVELDKDVYRPEDAEVDGVPAGTMSYEPGTIPTLPPGTKLNGIPSGLSSDDRTKFVRLVVGAAARCVTAPVNLIMGDSSDSNMASAAMDNQPWMTWVRNDRTDFAPILRKVFRLWHDRAKLVSGYIPLQARTRFPHDFYYDSTFEHPDPQKRANARSVDLGSGSTTIHKVYTDQGLNPRRERTREAQTLGLTMEEYNKLVISVRASAPSLIEEEPDETEESTTTQEGEA